ncbi:MAG: ATP-binding protein [Coriobacteriia bacterium]|nr:ATP-binding protein [Coriobacteriia bacterium]
MASGKGGTGKTTLTAAFAHLAAAHNRVVVADADVEASNLPLALRVRTDDCLAFSGGAEASIDESTCSACGACHDVCRFAAILPGTDHYLVDHLSCEGCGRCEHECPVGAITMRVRTVGEACTGSSSIGPAAFGQLGPGQDLSGRLVTEVRRLASEAAGRHDADLLLIDGPPGVGCPLIAAVASTDLLVAVAEPSVSGAHDLERLVKLARRLNLPVLVVLNKADLAEEGAKRIRALSRDHSLPIIAEVPFDPTIAGMLEALASGRDAMAVRTPALVAITEAWDRVRDELNGGI